MSYINKHASTLVTSNQLAMIQVTFLVISGLTMNIAN